MSIMFRLFRGHEKKEDHEEVDRRLSKLEREAKDMARRVHEIEVEAGIVSRQRPRAVNGD